MHIAIVRFPAVPEERDQDFRDWFAKFNDQLRQTAELKSRRLLRAPDGSYTALVELESAGAFVTMRQAEAVSMIHAGLGSILSNSLQATNYDLVADFSTSHARCAIRGGNTSHAAALDPVSDGCCRGE